MHPLTPMQSVSRRRRATQPQAQPQAQAQARAQIHAHNIRQELDAIVYRLKQIKSNIAAAKKRPGTTNVARRASWGRGLNAVGRNLNHKVRAHLPKLTQPANKKYVVRGRMNAMVATVLADLARAKNNSMRAV